MNVVKTVTKTVPKSKGLPIFGNTINILLAGGAPKLHEYIDKKHKKMGEIFVENLGTAEAIFISSHEMMRSVFAQEGKHPMHVLPEAWTVYNRLYGCSRGLFFMDGDEWLHNRRIMNKLLLKGNFRFIDEATTFIADSFKVDAEVNDLEDRLYRWSLDTITAVLIGPKVFSQHHHQLDAHLDELSHTVRRIFETSARLQLVPARQASKYRIKSWLEFERAVDDAWHSASDLVYYLLRLARSDSNGLLSLMEQQSVPNGDIMRIVIDLILAAGDTTAYSMQWILYCLGANPHLQERPLSLRNVIRETLRLYPVAPFLTRISHHDLKLCGYVIPKGSLLIFSLYTACRDATIFPNPDKFIPSRWNDKDPHMVQASIPFAMGSRSCIGKRIADMQMAKTLESVINKYRVECANGENVNMILKMIAAPDKSIRLKFVKKN